MKRILFFAFFVLFFINISVAQQHDKTWFVGNGLSNGPSAKFDFQPNLVLSDTVYRDLALNRSYVSLCDSLGNLLFYSNGIQIYNSAYQLMQNGDSLNPGQMADDFRTVGYNIPEGMISIPHPKQSNKYYIFHQSRTYSSSNVGLSENLYYTLIDMNVNNGLGRVEEKNQVLASDSICGGQLEAVKHGNGKDWWLIQPLGGSNGFYTFLVTEDTIFLSQKQYIGNNNRFAGYESTGQAVFSPDGSKYVRYDSENDLDIFDFDRCSGLLSNLIHIPIQDSADISLNLVGGGTAISTNNRYLYVSSYVDLYQFDLFSFNIPSTKTTVAHYDYFSDGLPTIFGYLQLAPDGIIYGYAESTRYLHLIKFPDLTGIGCDVRQHQIFIHHYNGHFIPNFPHYRTPALAGSPCDTLTSTAAIAQPQEQGIKLYPNPASTTISLESTTTIQQIVVYNALGQQVMRQGGKEQFLLELETSDLENGAYFLSIWCEGKVMTKQFRVLR